MTPLLPSRSSCNTSGNPFIMEIYPLSSAFEAIHLLSCFPRCFAQVIWITQTLSWLAARTQSRSDSESVHARRCHLPSQLLHDLALEQHPGLQVRNGRCGSSLATNGINLVNEHDAWSLTPEICKIRKSAKTRTPTIMPQAFLARSRKQQPSWENSECNVLEKPACRGKRIQPSLFFMMTYAPPNHESIEPSSLLLRLLEDVTHARSTNANKKLNELRGG